MRPDATKHNPSPSYLRQLLRRTGLSQREAAEMIGLPLRTLEDFLSAKCKARADYRTQFALEVLAEAADRVRTARTVEVARAA